MKYPAGYRVDWHQHDWSQFVYANEGAMTVSVEGDRWVVPPRRAIWVPAGQPHQIETHGTVFLRTVYLDSRPLQCGDEPCVVDVNPLLHELIQHLCERGIVRPENAADATLIQFFEQRLQAVQPIDSALRMPMDVRARRFAERLLENPGTEDRLEKIAEECGSSLRTLQRLFRRDVGLSIGKWRHRVRMLRAVERLGRGEPVTQIAISLGFDSISAFIHSFKQTYGQTPGRYRSAQ